MKSMTLDEYKILLEKHDWFTFYSDDWQVRKRGEKEEEEEMLDLACQHGSEYQRAYMDKLDAVVKGV